MEYIIGYFDFYYKRIVTESSQELLLLYIDEKMCRTTSEICQGHYPLIETRLARVKLS